MKPFKETYIIKYDYQKEDGFWVWSAEKEIDIDVKHGINEKNNHKEAGGLFLKQNPKARIKLITYV